jgi:hypothetical protein
MKRDRALRTSRSEFHSLIVRIYISCAMGNFKDCSFHATEHYFKDYNYLASLSTTPITINSITKMVLEFIRMLCYCLDPIPISTTMQDSSNVDESIGDNKESVCTQNEFTKAVGLCPSASHNAPVDKENDKDQVRR